MFNSMMKKYNVYTFTTELNDYKEEIKTPVLHKEVEMFISLATHNPYSNNQLNLTQVTHIGITSDRTLAKGMRVDDRFTIEFINDAAIHVIVYLKEVV